MFFKILIKNIFYFFKRIIDFWIKDSLSFLKENFEKIIKKLEKTFAIKVNFYYLFSPLYQDYTPVGYFFGFLIRFFKILFGSFIYLFLFLLFLFIYLSIILLPFFLIFKF